MFAPRTGVPLVAAAIVLGGVGALLGLRQPPTVLSLDLGWIVLVGLWAFLAAFFRDPERSIGDGIVSAADGRVREVGPVGSELLVSVFMNVTDVHVNRLPWAGRVAEVGDAGAGHRAAYRTDADRNVARTYRL
ncbi:phosphatidylserine decarboxylase related protein, partial [mine drainage metagenome]